MILKDADYFTRRALSELERAAAADDDYIAAVHGRLSALHLDHARTIIDDELGAAYETPAVKTPFILIAA